MNSVIIRLLCGMMLLSLVCLCSAGCSNNVPTETTATENPPPLQIQEVQVVLLLGQSNAEGTTRYGYLLEHLEQEAFLKYARGFQNVKMSYITLPGTGNSNSSDGKFVPVKLGQGVASEFFGPEVGMAEKISEAMSDEDVYIIKYTYGGTDLYSQWRPASSDGAGEQYVGAVAYILEQCKKLESMGFRPVVKAICWMQGESDAILLQGATAYQALEGRLVQELRRELEAYKPAGAEIGFVDAGISDSPHWVYYKSVNDAKKALADKDDYHDYIDTIAAGLTYDMEPTGNADLCHYDSMSELRLGHLFAEVLLSKYLDHQ